MLKCELKLLRDRIRNFSSSARQQRQRWMKFYAQFVAPGELCFDVGGNLGNRTDIFLGLGANVVTVEPQQFCATYLRRRFGKNSKFNLVQKALGERPGTADMHVCSSHTLSSLSADWINQVKSSGRFSDYQWDQRQTVELTTLDELIREYGRPVFCKIDVEGFEYEVLKGLTTPIKAVSLEFSRECLENTRQCVRYLEGLGHLVLNYSACESLEFEYAEWQPVDRMLGFLEALEPTSWGDIYARFETGSTV